MTEKIKLITAKLSPYGHRVEAALIEKNIPYEKEEIDLANRPNWFVEKSPLGKVPLLFVEDKVLFESIVICEFLEEFSTGNPLHSNDIFTKNWHRAWIEFSNGIAASVLGMVFSQNQEQFDIKKTETITKLALLDKNIKNTSSFDGEKFLLIDICLASALKPLTLIDSKFNLGILENFPNSLTYIESIIRRESFVRALPSNYEELFSSFLERKKSFLLQLSLGF